MNDKVLEEYNKSNIHRQYKRDLPVNNPDPIGEMVVSGAILGTPLKLVGKYIGKPLLKYTGKGLSKVFDLYKDTTNGLRMQNANVLINKGKQKLIDWQSSDFYKSRLINNGYGNKITQNIEFLKNIPINFSKTRKQLGYKGASKPKTTNFTIIDEDGARNAVWDPIIEVANDTKFTEQIPIHELLHSQAKLVQHSQPLSIGTQNINGQTIDIYFGTPFTRKIISKSEELLPKPHKIIEESLSKTKDDAIKNIMSSMNINKKQANKFFNNYVYTSMPSESRSFLQTDFIDKILPNLKNPNNLDEVLQFLNNTSQNKLFTKESRNIIKARNMSNYDLAKYFSQALSLTPIIYASNKE